MQLMKNYLTGPMIKMDKNIKISELTAQQKTLLWARHEYPEYKWRIIDGEAVADLTMFSEKVVVLDWNTVGPVWERDGLRIINKMAAECADKDMYDVNIEMLLYKTLDIEVLATALLEYWFPQGVDEEMLR